MHSQLTYRCCLVSILIPIIKIRQFHKCLIIIMGIPIPGRTVSVFILKWGPGTSVLSTRIQETYSIFGFSSWLLPFVLDIFTTGHQLSTYHSPHSFDTDLSDVNTHHSLWIPCSKAIPMVTPQLPGSATRISIMSGSTNSGHDILHHQHSDAAIWSPHAWCHHQMETFSVLLAICAGNSPVLSEFRTKASDAELWCFLWCAPEWTVEKTIVRLVIGDAIAPIVMLL